VLHCNYSRHEERADDDPLVTKEMLFKASTSYLRGHDPRDPLASPLYGSLAGVPPIQLHVGASEVLLDDAAVKDRRPIPSKSICDGFYMVRGHGEFPEWPRRSEYEQRTRKKPRDG
jgi:acetyl esterase/lipase